jgi:hypothetical protein
MTLYCLLTIRGVVLQEVVVAVAVAVVVVVAVAGNYSFNKIKKSIKKELKIRFSS